MSKKLTYEEVKYFVEVESNSGCKLISKEYINNHKKLHFRCKCGNEFLKTLLNFKSKMQCRDCSNCQELTYEKVKHFIEVENKSGCKLLSTEYKKVSEKLKLLCNCGEVFYSSFSSLKWSRKHFVCNNCSYKIIKNKKINSNKDQVMLKIDNVHNGNIVLLGAYTSANTDTLFKHLECGYEWMTKPTRVSSGRGCPKCNQKVRYTHEEFVDFIEQRYNKEIEVLSEYVVGHDEITVKHLICGTVYETTRNRLSYGIGCPYCTTGTKKMNLKIVRRKMYEKYKGEFVFLSNEYSGMMSNYKFKHSKCGSIFTCNLAVFLYTNRVSCPVCNQSKGEKRIEKWLLENNFERYKGYISQKQFNNLIGLGGGLLSYDFYLPKNNLLIEYQGEFHDGTVRHQLDSDLQKQKEHDKRKRNYALNNNINLLEIWYWDFDNIEEILSKELSIKTHKKNP